MPQKQSKAVVLGASIFGEQDKLVVLLTEDQGIISAVAPGASKYKSRFGSLFELFTEGMFVYYEKENRDLVTISSGDILASHFFSVSDSEKIFYFYFIAEVVRRFHPGRDHSNRVYNLLTAILKASDSTVSMDRFLLYFLIWMLRIEGVLFRTRLCSNCLSKKVQDMFVRDDYKGLLCPLCQSGEAISLTTGELKLIDRTQKKSPADMAEMGDRIDLTKLIRIFVRMIEYYAEINLKSKQYFPTLFT